MVRHRRGGKTDIGRGQMERMFCQNQQRSSDRQIVAFDKADKSQYRDDREVITAERDAVELAPEHKPGLVGGSTTCVQCHHCDLPVVPNRGRPRRRNARRKAKAARSKYQSKTPHLARIEAPHISVIAVGAGLAPCPCPNRRAVFLSALVRPPLGLERNRARIRGRGTRAASCPPAARARRRPRRSPPPRRRRSRARRS